jgi:hypothetical protein
MFTILTKNKMNGIKKSIHSPKYSAPYKLAERDQAGRTNSRTNCQQNRIAISPQGVHQLVSLLHNSSHYIVLEIDIPGRIFKIYDGLSRELIQWMDHIVLALKKYMLMDVSYASSHPIQ